MIDLDKKFTIDNIDEPILASFNPAINFTRINSSNGQMLFTETKVYLIPELAGTLSLFSGKCFEYSEVVSYKRKLIAGYEIVLKDGSKVLLSNVFGKMRAGITAELDAHVKA